MPRTTPELVDAILDDRDEEISLEAPIIMANELVTEICAVQKRSDGTLWHTETRLELIERNLAAHFYHIIDPQIRQEVISTLQTSFQAKVDLGLDQTRYGQQAKLLDTSGALGKLDEDIKNGRRGKVRFKWLGKKAESSQW